MSIDDETRKKTMKDYYSPQECDIVIIGAGIVGLSVAINIQNQNKNYEIIIIEKESDVSKHQSGRNSGVIHSGIYYNPNSLKFQLCTRGRELLLKYAKEKNIAFDLSGKIIVDNDRDKLQELESKAKDLGLDGVRIIDGEELHAKEPNLLFQEGLFVPQAGVIDYLAVSKSIKKDFLGRGGEIIFNEEIVSINNKDNIKILKSANYTYKAKYIVNCAGLYSDKIARLDKLNPSIRIIPFRGEYYTIRNNQKNLINSMVYPLSDPQLPFLGIHLTKTIEGNIEAGPNAVFAFAKEGYTWTKINLFELFSSVSFIGFWRLVSKYLSTGMSEMYRSLRKKKFLDEINRFVKEVQLKDLVPKISGVRAQAVDRRGNLIDDFYFLEGENSLHILNAPSPAATASLAIGEYISAKVSLKL